MSDFVTVTSAETHYRIHNGKSCVFGRRPTPLYNEPCIVFAENDDHVSRTHFRINAMPYGWTITCVSEHLPVAILDTDSLTSITLNHLQPPMPISFPQAVVAVTTIQDTYSFQVTDDRARVTAAADRKAIEQGIRTRKSGEGIEKAKTNGVERAWFVSLVALCEPILTRTPGTLLPKLPSDQEIAGRLKLSVRTIEGHFMTARQQLQIPEGATNQRNRLVEHAIVWGIVERSDLNLLP